jgi:oligopeptide transport system ATP-binding protein
MEKDVILSINDLNVKFKLRGKTLHAIRGVSLDIYKGEVIAIVGESGSGKSVFTKNFLGLLDSNGYIDGGNIMYQGQDLAKLTQKKWSKAGIRGKEIAMIMQDPMTSLNPLKSIGDQIAEAIMIHKKVPKSVAKLEALNCLRDVEIGDVERRYKQYPHEFSGGMRQRVVIAMAIACSPKILICDEPTTALDVTIQAQVLKLIKNLKEKYDLTVVFITHDLGVVANIADRVAVMYAGDIVEIGNSEEIFYNAKHPYTKALLKSLPNIAEKGSDLHSIKGTPPSLFGEIVGDASAPRNPEALNIDYLETPPYFTVSPTHKAKTWLLDPRFEKYNGEG